MVEKMIAEALEGVLERLKMMETNCGKLLLGSYGRIVAYVNFPCLGRPTTECLNNGFREA